VKVEVDSGAATPSGDALVTVSNPRATNAADNRASVPVARPTSPAGAHSSCGRTLCTATAPAGSGQVQVTVHTAGGSSGLPFTCT
jgi:hypothetical protein